MSTEEDKMKPFNTDLCPDYFYEPISLEDRLIQMLKSVKHKMTLAKYVRTLKHIKEGKIKSITVEISETSQETLTIQYST